MILWTLQEIKAALGNQIVKADLTENFSIKNVFIDSRKKIEDGLFIALKGENTDGHKYLAQAFENGAKLAIIDDISHENIDENFKLSHNFHRLIVVKNTYKALENLAIFSRKRSLAKIIALTGSVGKTGTKDMLKLVFASQGKTYANHGNFNNHIGLPLSLANLERDCQYAILEMGMNHLNEITYLSNIAKPHLAIITNVGPAHIEFFKDEQEIAVAKSEIFSGLVEGGKVLLNADNAHFEFLKKQVSAYKISDKNIFSFGENSQTNYQILKIDLISPNLSKITVRNDAKQNYHYEIGSINRGAINNSIIVFALLDLIGKDVQKGLDQLKNFTTSEGRGKILEIEIENKKITIIDDTYNASLLSIKMGIENCQDFKNLLNKKRLLCAIGDMRELGSKSQNIHQEILDFIDKKHFAKVFLVGQEMKIANDKLKISNSINFSDSTELAEKISNFLEDGDILYIKGSRGIKMEKIIEKLTNKTSVH